MAPIAVVLRSLPLFAAVFRSALWRVRPCIKRKPWLSHAAKSVLRKSRKSMRRVARRTLPVGAVLASSFASFCATGMVPWHP
jgi:hypothetical protein